MDAAADNTAGLKDIISLDQKLKTINVDYCKIKHEFFSISMY